MKNHKVKRKRQKTRGDVVFYTMDQEELSVQVPVKQGRIWSEETDKIIWGWKVGNGLSRKSSKFKTSRCEVGLAHRKKEVVSVTGMLGAKEKMVRLKTGEAEVAPWVLGYCFQWDEDHVSFERGTQVPLCSYLSLSSSTQSRSVRTDRVKSREEEPGKWRRSDRPPQCQHILWFAAWKTQTMVCFQQWTQNTNSGLWTRSFWGDDIPRCLLKGQFYNMQL